MFQAEGDRRVSGNPKRILLTGGAGFIGSHVAEALLRNHVALSIVDNLDEFYSPAWKKANLESVRKVGPFDFFDRDICAMDRLRETVASVRPDAIIHLAARAGVRPSIEQPRLYEQVNVAGTVNLLELCREFQVRVWRQQPGAFFRRAIRPAPHLAVRRHQARGGIVLLYVRASLQTAGDGSPILHRVRTTTAP